MSKEEAHKLIDRLYDLKYYGSCTFDFIEGAVNRVRVEQSLKVAGQMVLVVG